MAIKQRSRPMSAEELAKKADELASQMADKPYGKSKETEVEGWRNLTLYLPESMVRKLEDLALANKRSGKEPKSISAMARAAFQEFLDRNQ